MRKISDCVSEIVAERNFLRFGLARKLFNLTHLAEFLLPLVEARAKKEVSRAAVLMSLSRLAASMELSEIVPEQFRIERLSVHSSLSLLSLESNAENQRYVQRLYALARKRELYMTITEGLLETTIIFDQQLELSNPRPKSSRYLPSLSSLGLSFRMEYSDVPGFLYLVLQQIALQNINVLEVASTTREFILYLKDDDIELAFETLYRSFSIERRG